MDNYFVEDEVLGKAYDSRIMKRLLKFLAPYKKLVMISIFLLILLSLSEIAGPIIIKIAIDGPIEEGKYNELLLYVAIFFALQIFQAILRVLQIYFPTIVGQNVMCDLRERLFSHLQNLSVSFHSKNPVGRLITRVTNDVETLNELFTSGVIAIFSDILLLIAIIIAMFCLNAKMALIALSVMPLIIIVSVVFKSKARVSYREIRKKLARVNSFIQETISGMKVIKVFNREERFNSRFKSLNKDYYEEGLRVILYWALFFPSLMVLSYISIALMVWYGGNQILANVLTFGEFVAFWFYAQKFYEPIMDLSEKYNILQSAMASCERIFKLLDTPVEIEDSEKPFEPEGVDGNIEFKNVWFSYDDGNYVSKDLNFKVRKGESVAIVGPTGAGKSTIINLLLRFYEPQRGKILIDDMEINRINKRNLRSQFGIVLQEVFLFSGDIQENIRLSSKEIPEEKVIESARYVNADPFIRRLPDDYRSEVKERGTTLSVGQKQLLAFARALSFEPKILILDEATSNIDTETELLIQNAIEKVMRDRTSIIIAHRLSTIKKVDKIIVLHKGEIREEGNHRELIEKRGLYHKLYKLQFEKEGLS